MNLEQKIPQLQLKRKLVHVLFGILGLILITYNILTPTIIFFILMFGLILSVLSLKIRVPIISYFLDNFESPRDKKQFPGRGFLLAMAGALLALQLFQRDVALASIAILTFADPISHFVGKVFGKTKNFFDGRKNIEGHIAGALISSLVAMFFVSPYLAIAGAIMAMLFESIVIEIQKIELDDNLLIPLVAGTTMFLILRYFI